MPFKDFVAGQPLAAADVDTYLMRQTAMTFASAAARDAALASVLDEGMVAYLEDKNRFTYYDGSSWLVKSGLVGATLARVANQTIGAATLTAVTFDTEVDDSDAFATVPGTGVTIPTGLGGVYACTFKASVGASGTVRLTVDGTQAFDSFASSWSGSATVTIVIGIGAGATVVPSVYVPAGGNITARFDCFMVSGG